MSIGFYLKNKTQKVSSIQTIVAFKGRYYKRTTGESVPVDKWNSSSQRCKVIGFAGAESVNKVLNEIYLATYNACNYFVGQRQIPENKEFWAEVDKILTGGVVAPTITFTEYLARYIEKISGVRAISTSKKYVTTHNKLRDYEEERGKRLKFEDMDLQFYSDFEKWFYSKGYSSNYFGSIIKNIKVVIREARDVDHLHTFDIVENRRFKVVQETADTVYLTEEELLKIHRLVITEELIRQTFDDTDERAHNIARKLKSLEIVRAKFLIGAFTALRVSDFNRLDTVNLKEDYIRIKTQKTGTNITVPIHWVIREILEGGFDISTKISDQKINKHIKEIAQLAGITELIELSGNEGGKVMTKTVEKWTQITTHTARRSGATNMVKFGLPPLSVMKITGHSKWQSFMKYIKVSDDENAELMKQSGYFDKKEQGNE